MEQRCRGPTRHANPCCRPMRSAMRQRLRGLGAWTSLSWLSSHSSRPATSRAAAAHGSDLLIKAAAAPRGGAPSSLDSREASTSGAPPSSSSPAPRAAYVHLPFCKRKCHYCDFPVIAVGMEGGADAKNQENMEEYVEVLLREIAATRVLGGAPLQSVFFGGGTPSLLSLPLLERVLCALEARFGLAAGAEISIEADPGTFDAARLRSYMGLGVSRVSVGVQSFDDELLRVCGRAHDLADVHRAVEAVHAAGVPSWSLDLMSGLPGLTEEGWQRSLEAAVDAAPHHVSVYDLQVEEHTPFAKRYRPGEAPLPSDDSAARMLGQASTTLAAAGYERYEVSNYARPGHRCAHNMVYWRGEAFHGFGLGSASYLEGRRFSRPKRLGAYRRWVEEMAAWAAAGGPQLPAAHLPPESAQERLLDTVMLRLRLADGLDLRQLEAQHPERPGVGAIVLAALQPHIAAGSVLAASSSSSGSSSSGVPGHVRLADPQGYTVSNDIISDVFAALDEDEE